MELTFLITSGPTREYLDPVRFLSNASSGRMGLCLAKEVLKRKYKLIFISGPCESPKLHGNARQINVVTARQMFQAVRKFFGKCDIAIAAAAVSDYRPKKSMPGKIKKTGKVLELKLVRNPDILAMMGSRKGGKVLAGFALETENVLRNAKHKLVQKNLDLIVANEPGAINSANTRATLIHKRGQDIRTGYISKQNLAKRIIDETLRIYKNNKAG